MAKRRSFFDEVDPKVDFPAMEREILDYWDKSGIVKKYLSLNRNSKKRFSFLDGPITANNPMGVHHAWGRTYKDLWQRFKNMQGMRQRFQNGFDAQGLWVEVEVEKELGLKSKKDIENLVAGDVKKSIARFVDLCKKRVFKYAAIQTQQSKRLGYFMDWDNSYFTLSDENNYMIWYFLKRCQGKGLIYKGTDSVPWCPRCGTAISQHEILTENYKKVSHQAVYVAYPIDLERGEHLLIWTTTPWTLPANVAVAIDPKMDYVLAKDDSGKKYYVLDGKAEGLRLKVIKRLKGKKLIGLTYQSSFDDLPRVKKALGSYKHRVVSTDERILKITANEGTGLVHIATGAGGEDFALGKKENLPVIGVIDEEAGYLDGLGEFSGKNAKDNPRVIIDYLIKKKVIFKEEKYRHKYPVCWRCKTELVWRVVDEWYIAMDPLREAMKRVAKKITWIPAFGLKRELDWLSNMDDWLISKKRYWGLALPIWECKKCRNFEVIGSKKELEKRAVEGWKRFRGHTPHRPWIDEVKIKCGQCDETVTRISDVGSPWLDAGIVSFSTITANNKGTPLYLKDKKEWEKWFPADFITESFPGQFKNWFYSLIAMSTVLEERRPFKTVLGFATLLAENGRPMHKSLGNAIEFNEGADKIGVDVMRWMYLRQDPKDNLLFGYKVADETRRRFHLKLWNVYNFFVTYANIDGWRPNGQSPVDGPSPALDRWIYSRLNQTIKAVTEYLGKYNAYDASATIEEFVNDLSNWYIRRSRERVGPAAESEKDKERFYRTCYKVLVHLTKVLAPFTPYFSEVIYQNLTKQNSVHLTDWPKSGKVDIHLTSQMAVLRGMVEKAHAARKEEKLPVRQPLWSIKVGSVDKKPPVELLSLAKGELNIRNINWREDKELSVRLDTRLTPELREEARARELIRKIQDERKSMGINLTQRIRVTSPWLPKSKEVIQKVARKTLAKKLEKGKFKLSKAS